MTAFPPLRSFLVAALLAASLATAASARVIVVDPQGGTGVQLLLDAIEEAADGDVLLLRPGDYTTGHPQPFEVLGKSLALVGDGGGEPVVLPGLVLRGSLGFDPMLVRGLVLQRPAGAGGEGAALQVLPTQSVVWIEGCRLLGRDASFLPAPMPADAALRVVQSGHVVVARSVLRGGDGHDAGQDGAPASAAGGAGLDLLQSRAAVFGGIARGGRGGNGPAAASRAADGGAGGHLSLAELVIHGGALIGGDEGHGNEGFVSPGAGLDGPEGSLVWLRGTAVEAGKVHGAGTQAPDLALDPAAVLEFRAAPRGLSVPAPLRETQPGAFQLEGVQGDLVWLFVTAVPQWELLGFHQGAWLMTMQPGLTTTLPFVVAIHEPDGTATIPFLTPRLPPGFTDGVLLFIQAVHFGADGVTAGAPASAVWLAEGL